MPAHKHIPRKSTNIAFKKLSDLKQKKPSIKAVKKASAIHVAIKDKTINKALIFDKDILHKSISNYIRNFKQDDGALQAVPDIPDTPPPPVRKNKLNAKRYKQSKIKKSHKIRRSKEGRR